MATHTEQELRIYIAHILKDKVKRGVDVTSLAWAIAQEAKLSYAAEHAQKLEHIFCADEEGWDNEG